MAAITYASFVSWLLSLGSQLPQALTLINEIVAKSQELVTLIKDTLPAEMLVDVSPEVEQLEAELADKLGGGTAQFDGSRLRALWKFANDSGLLPVLISLLTKSV